MNIIDISWPIVEGMTEYKDRSSVRLATIQHGATAGVKESQISLHAHTGTHVDAPAHFLPEGLTSENLDLTALIGPCRVIDCTTVQEKITREILQNLDINRDERLLFKTKNSFRELHQSFDYDFIYLDAEAAEYLASKNSKAVGIDYLGIERNQKDHATHTALMKKNIPIIEGLRLAQVQAGIYILMCLPLAIAGLDAAPARAILIDRYP